MELGSKLWAITTMVLFVAAPVGMTLVFLYNERRRKRKEKSLIDAL